MEFLATLFRHIRAVFGIFSIRSRGTFLWALKAIAPDFLVSPTNLRGKRVLITGGGSGLGAMLAKKFAAHGAVLVLWDIDDAALKRTEGEIRALGSKCYCYNVDISEKDQIYAAAKKVLNDVGGADIIINNAGVLAVGNLLEIEDKKITKSMDINALAHFWVLKSFLPKMIENKFGHIVTIASSAGLMGSFSVSSYCASKFAAVGIHESVQAELLMDPRTRGHINMTLVCPHFIKGTAMAQGGPKSYLPWLVPDLPVEYVADRIIRAVRRRDSFLMMPRALYILLYTKSVTPYLVSFYMAGPSGLHVWLQNCPSPSTIDKALAR